MSYYAIDIALLPSVEDLQSKSDLMIAFSIAFLVLTWTAVALRVYVRAGMIRAFGLDDWAMLFALVTFTSFCACLVVIAKYPSSQEVVDAYDAQSVPLVLGVIKQALLYVLIYNALYVLTTIIIKVSLAIFFLRIVIRPWQRRLVYGATATYTIYGFVYTFLVTFHCGNPANLISNAIEGKCMPDEILMPLVYISGVMNCVTDWTFACLPGFILWHSNMPRKTKISAGILLCMGCLGSVASVIRIAYLSGLALNINFFKHCIDAGLLSVIEPGLAITAASLSTLRPLFKSVIERTLPTFVSAGYGRSKNATDLSQRRQGRSQLNYDDQKGFQLFDHAHSRTHTIIAATDPKMDIINEYELSHEDGAYMNRSGSQNSLVEEHLNSRPWAPHGRGVMMTRHVNVSEE